MKRTMRDEVVITKEESPPQGPQNAKERFYEKLRMPLWVLDVIIAALVIAVVVFLVLGSGKSNPF